MHEHPELKIRHFQAVNSYSERLYAVLVDHKQSQSETCIVFLHGLGSNILEGSLLIEHLPPKMALCCFDFSGSGKSQGKCTTYGIKQHKDIGRTVISKVLFYWSYRRKALKNLFFGDDRWVHSRVWPTQQKIPNRTKSAYKFQTHLSAIFNRYVSNVRENILKYLKCQSIHQ